MKLKLFFIIIFFGANVFSLSSNADSFVKNNKELTRLQVKIKQISAVINNLKAEKNKLDNELKKIEIQYGRSSNELKKLEIHVKNLNVILEKNRQQIALKKREIHSQKQGIEALVKAAHGMGRNEKLKLLLNQQAPSLSGRMLNYYDYFNKARLKKINKIDSDLQQVRLLEAERIKETAVLEYKVEKRKQSRSLLLATKKQRKAVLAKINKQFISKNRQLVQFKAREKRLKSLVLSLQQAMDDFPFEEGAVKAFSQLKGSLPWPVKGSLEKKFGAQRSDSRWDGVLISAQEGKDVRAITRGRVVYADWLRGYGLLTIIEHGKGYMTLYAFNQSLYKTVGDWVDAGTIIAAVGQSGGQSKAGLYFGIRKKGKPVNPLKWCRAIRNGKVR